MIISISNFYHNLSLHKLDFLFPKRDARRLLFANILFSFILQKENHEWLPFSKDNDPALCMSSESGDPTSEPRNFLSL